MLSDEILWEGMLGGNSTMFMALYKKYYHLLLFIGMKDIRDAQLVKDTIQQTFLYIWEKRSTLHNAKDVKAYLVSSFRRKLSNDWKKTGKISSLHVIHSEFSEDMDPTPEEMLIVKDEHKFVVQQVLDSINELPARQRELIQRRFYDGLSYDEIAHQTGLSHRTIYNKIFEALKTLRGEIGQRSHVASASSIITLTVFFVAIAFTFLKF